MKNMILFITLIFIAAGISFAIPFLPSVGGKASKADRENYKKRAYNYDGKVFHNDPEVGVMEKVEDNDPARMSGNGTSPDFELPVKKPQIENNPDENFFAITWLGHSSLFIQMHGRNILVDPVFSERISPVSWIGPKRFSQPSVAIDDLPEIDILILTHDHYDHMDYGALKKLAPKVKKYVVPLGVECHLRKWKFDMKKISNMAWWEEIDSDGIMVAATPAQHFSGRWITGRNETLWNSYVLKDDHHQIFLSGDSGYGEHFKKIHEKYGDFDLAVMECGQYNVRWPSIHSFPEQTVQEAIDVGAKLAIPVHWGAIVLSTNGWDDSVLRFVKAAEEKKLNYITPYLCETVDISNPQDYKVQWWN